MAAIKTESADGLSNRALLDKVDKLRELGISDQVPLPQMVVVGDQSAGKSSVLDSLTGFHFPRAVTLCTRHATEIICRREEKRSIVISIHAVDADVEKAKAFRREATDLNGAEFAQIFEDAAEVMGIKTGSDGGSSAAFSRDILKVEISGPNEDHLTVIDVPGMFENVTPGVTTKDDIDLVKTMVRRYINESRTIILAVVPCNGDIANQKILTYAAEVDPDGKRTLGVLTKPDLAVEKATKDVIVDLVLGKRRDLQLGYCLVKNRGADDTSSSAVDRNKEESAFFREAPWTKLPSDRLGIPALKDRIQYLLMDRTKSEFPKVRAELKAKLKENELLIKDLGESRATTEQQRLYIGHVAAEFNQIKDYGLDAYYTRHKIFEDSGLKLITRMREINEQFSKVFYAKGHTRAFASEVGARAQEDSSDDAIESTDSDEICDPSRDDLYDGASNFKIPCRDEEELGGILSDPFACPAPTSEDIMSHLEREYLTSRGYELGTFSGEMLPATFKEQSKKWPKLAHAHVSNAILVVHHFIATVFDVVCPDPDIRSELWAHLLEDLHKRYQRAVDHTEFLLNVEFTTKSITYNPAFDKVLANCKNTQAQELLQRATGKLVKETVTYADGRKLVSGSSASKILSQSVDEASGVSTTSLEATRKNIHDVLHSYYDIARSRFADVICQQVIDHFLLHAPDSPLAILSHSAVLKMTPDQLEAIAGENMISRERREKLTRDIEDMKKALRILRG